MRKLPTLALLLLLFSCGQSSAPPQPEKNNDSTTSHVPHDAADTAKRVETATAKPDPMVLLAAFIPKGYSILDTTSGDLNLDAYADMVLVLKKDGEDTTSDVTEHPEKRPLVILTGQPDHTYKQAARNDNAVYCVDCGGMMGDPFTGVVIKNGYFSVEHYGGSSERWTRTITFKYAKADGYWYLHKDGGTGFSTFEPEDVSNTVKTVKDFGRVPFHAFDIYE